MRDVHVFAACPLCERGEASRWLERLRAFARAAEEAGCSGALLSADSAQPDPWLTAQALIDATRRLSPLVAVQPAHLHPYSTAKMVATLGFLHGRRVYLNLVAGGFRNDLAALNDATPHDERYARLAEHAGLVQRLLGSAQPVSFAGRYYAVSNLKLVPALPRELAPGLLVSGTTPAGLDAARRLQAVAVEYAPAVEELAPHGPGSPRGLRIGIVARASDDEAWAAARARYPLPRKRAAAEGYWAEPFRNYLAASPLLVGSHARVASHLARYREARYGTFLLDVAPEPGEMQHLGAVLERAARQALAA
jgi:alkanesulfonate monooxygenase